MITLGFPTFQLINKRVSNGPWLTDFDGILSSATQILNLDKRPEGDGRFDDASVFDDARYLVVEGSIVDTNQAVREFHRGLLSLKSGESTFSFQYTDQWAAYELAVKIDGKVGFTLEREENPCVASFKFQLVAIDPMLYFGKQVAVTGPPLPGGGFVFPATFPVDFGVPGYPGQLTLTNEGTGDSYPSLAISGGLPGGFEIICVETGATIRLGRNIPEGSTIFVDVAAGQAWIDGKSPVDVIGSWPGFVVPPNASRTLQFNPLAGVSGTPQLTATFWSADN